MPNPDVASSAAKEAQIVTKATVRAAAELAMSGAVLARVLGVSEATASRLRTAQAVLPRDGKPFELALLFIRLYRSLDAIIGGDRAVARAWLCNRNAVLGGAPVDLIQTVRGLTDVIAYLDARRAII